MIGRVHISDLFLFDVDIGCLGGDWFEVVDTGAGAGYRVILLHHIESELLMGVGRNCRSAHALCQTNSTPP
jgi:hypothetical protein